MWTPPHNFQKRQHITKPQPFEVAFWETIGLTFLRFLLGFHAYQPQKAKDFLLQILRDYLMKKACSEIFILFCTDKERWAGKTQGLTRSKCFGFFKARWVSIHLWHMKSLLRRIVKNTGLCRRWVIDFLQYHLIKHMMNKRMQKKKYIGQNITASTTKTATTQLHLNFSIPQVNTIKLWLRFWPLCWNT